MAAAARLGAFSSFGGVEKSKCVLYSSTRKFFFDLMKNIKNSLKNNYFLPFIENCANVKKNYANAKNQKKITR